MVIRRGLVASAINDQFKCLPGCQFPTNKWYDLFNDPTIADAILDRIVHRAHVIELKGESIRKLKAKGV